MQSLPGTTLLASLLRSQLTISSRLSVAPALLLGHGGVQIRQAHSRKREKRRKARRLGQNRYTITGEKTEYSAREKVKKKKAEAEEDDGSVIKIPQGNAADKADISSVKAIRANAQDILKTPVAERISNKVELKKSSQLRTPKPIPTEENKEKEPEVKQRSGDEETDESYQRDKIDEMKRVVFADRKDYIGYQIRYLKERAQNKEKISAHRFSGLFKEKTLTEPEATQLFDIAREAKIVDAVLYNAYITFFAKRDRVDSALGVLNKMRTDKVRPNLVTYNIFIDMFCRLEQYHEAIAIFDSLRAKQLEPDRHITFNILISNFANKKQLDMALEFYEKMRKMDIKPDIVIHNTILKMYCEANEYQKAHDIFQSLKRSKAAKPDNISYSILIDFLLKERRFADARDLLDEMKSTGLKPDVYLYSNIILYLGREGRLDSAIDAYDELIEDGLIPNATVYNALMEAYKKNGKPEKALAVMEELKRKQLVPTSSSYAALIEDYAKVANVAKGLEIIKQMKSTGVVPSEAIYTSLFDTIANTKDDQETKDNHTISILKMMKEDRRPPYQIFEKLAKEHLGSGPTYNFEFLLEIFRKGAYRIDEFFVNAFVETLAVNLKSLEPAVQFVENLIDAGKTDEDQRVYSWETFEILVRGFTIIDDFEGVKRIFRLWAASGIRIEETTCVPPLVKIILSGKKEAAAEIIQIAQKHGAKGKKVLEGLDHILTPTSHKERAEREKEWMAKNLQHPGQQHLTNMFKAQQEVKAVNKGGRAMSRNNESEKRLAQQNSREEMANQAMEDKEFDEDDEYENEDFEDEEPEEVDVKQKAASKKQNRRKEEEEDIMDEDSVEWFHQRKKSIRGSR